MKKQCRYFCFGFLLLVSLMGQAQSGVPAANSLTWTFTYLKATPSSKSKLREFLKKNWLAMDSIAVAQGLIKTYELIEHVEANPQTEPDWDFIVAVEYFTQGTYADIAGPFENIRKNHTIVQVDGLAMKDLAKIVRSETVKKSVYPARQ